MLAEIKRVFIVQDVHNGFLSMVPALADILYPFPTFLKPCSHWIRSGKQEMQALSAAASWSAYAPRTSAPSRTRRNHIFYVRGKLRKSHLSSHFTFILRRSPQTGCFSCRFINPNKVFLPDIQESAFESRYKEQAQSFQFPWKNKLLDSF